MKRLNYKCLECGGTKVRVEAWGTVPGWGLTGAILIGNVLQVAPTTMEIVDYEDDCYNVYRCAECDEIIFKGNDDTFIDYMQSEGFIKELKEGDASET